MKREGNNVTILERESVSVRSSHNAGVSYKAGMEEFLKRYDDTGLTTSFVSDNLHFAYLQWPSVYHTKLKYKVTSWGFLYRILRANFDGFASDACPQPPPPRAQDGTGVYLVGRHVTDMQYTDGLVTVHYSDVTCGGSGGKMVADLVIGADGLHSTVREIVKAPAARQYSGYVSWRGTVPERDLSKATADYFINGFSFDVLSRSYIIWYASQSHRHEVFPAADHSSWI